MGIITSIRFILGYLIVFLNFVCRPKRKNRSQSEQDTVDQETKQLTLYQFYLYRLGLSIEYRDAKRNKIHRQELLTEGGQIKVPCLRIEEGSETRWLYESRAINAYLSKKF
jgi:hypothetical protein